MKQRVLSPFSISNSKISLLCYYVHVSVIFSLGLSVQSDALFAQYAAYENHDTHCSG